MGLEMFVAATTSSGANYNSLANSMIKSSTYPRKVSRLGLAGSAAAYDVGFTLYFGQRKIGVFYPSTIGASTVADDDMKTLGGGEVCPPNVEIRLVADANATTNSVYGVIETFEMA